MDCKRTVDSAAAPLVLLVGTARHGSFRPVLGAAGIRPPFLLSSCLPPPIQRPAIPLAVRQQDKVQQHVDELRFGDIPISVSYTHLDVYKRQVLGSL